MAVLAVRLRNNTGNMWFRTQQDIVLPPKKVSKGTIPQADESPKNRTRHRSGCRRFMSNTSNGFNWSATNRLATTVKGQDKQHWSADQLIWSGRSILFGGYPFSSAVFPCLLYVNSFMAQKCGLAEKWSHAIRKKMEARGSANSLLSRLASVSCVRGLETLEPVYKRPIRMQLYWVIFSEAFSYASIVGWGDVCIQHQVVPFNIERFSYTLNVLCCQRHFYNDYKI